jgi:hypothetical protein
VAVCIVSILLALSLVLMATTLFSTITMKLFTVVLGGVLLLLAVKAVGLGLHQ